MSSFGGSPARQEIGLGDATAIKSLEVTWPASGLRQVFDAVQLDAMVEVTEGKKELNRIDLPRIRF